MGTRNFHGTLAGTTPPVQFENRKPAAGTAVIAYRLPHSNDWPRKSGVSVPSPERVTLGTSIETANDAVSEIGAVMVVLADASVLEIEPVPEPIHFRK